MEDVETKATSLWHRWSTYCTMAAVVSLLAAAIHNAMAGGASLVGPRLLAALLDSSVGQRARRFLPAHLQVAVPSEAPTAPDTDEDESDQAQLARPLLASRSASRSP